MVDESEPVSLGSELVIGLVGALGADLDSVYEAIRDALIGVGYTVSPIRLSELIHEVDRWKKLPERPREKRLTTHMDAGDEFRGIMERGDAMALLAIGAIREERDEARGRSVEAIPRRSFIFHSLKHPDEILRLEEIYGFGFHLVAAYSPRETRLDNLARSIAESHHESQATKFRPKAEELIQRDEADIANRYGQNVRATFPLAHVFLDTSDPEGLRKSAERFVELLFSHPFHTPTRDEYGMFHAKAAALRSASLSRQVGSVIASDKGDIIAVGANEVPKAGGGLYWSDDPTDHRDFTLGYDMSDRLRRNVLADILDRLRRAGWLAASIKDKDIDDLVGAALSGESKAALARGAQLMNLIEYGRAVHAEMAALMDSAARGVPVRGCTLFTTTFPCHDCARHILAAGIQRVVYVEPYPKSLAFELYPDSIAVDKPTGTTDQVRFEPFVGIAPKRYIDLFEMQDRKGENGKVLTWDRLHAEPRLAESPLAYLDRETADFSAFEREMIAKGLREDQRKGE